MKRMGRHWLVLSLMAAGCTAGRTAQWEAPAPSSLATGETPEALSAAADAAWAKRDEQSSVEAAIAAWEKVVAAKPDDAESWAKLARAYYFLADGHLRKGGDKSEPYLAAFEKGVVAGERGLAAANAQFKAKVTSGAKVEEAITACGPECTEPMYWYATNLGKWSRAKGFATTLGNKDKIKAVMTQVLKVNPTFFHGAPDRYFGAFYAVAPGFAGGDLNKSKEHFDKSLQLAPNYVGTKVLIADTYATKKQDRAMFEKLLAEVMAAPDDVIPGLEPETRNEKAKAQELKGKADELF